MAEYEPRELAEMNVHNAATYADSPAGKINREFMDLVRSLHDAGVEPHFADERTFEEGELAGDDLRIANCRYQRIIISQGCQFTAAGNELLRQLKRAKVATVSAAEINAPRVMPEPTAQGMHPTFGESAIPSPGTPGEGQGGGSTGNAPPPQPSPGVPGEGEKSVVNGPPEVSRTGVQTIMGIRSRGLPENFSSLAIRSPFELSPA
jgi:hypothetical protein